MTEAAREAARRLYKKYNYSNGPLSNYELSSLLAETYQHLNIRTHFYIQHSRPHSATSSPTRRSSMQIWMAKSPSRIFKQKQSNIYVAQGFYLKQAQHLIAGMNTGQFEQKRQPMTTSSSQRYLNLPQTMISVPAAGDMEQIFLLQPMVLPVLGNLTLMILEIIPHNRVWTLILIKSTMDMGTPIIPLSSICNLVRSKIRLQPRCITRMKVKSLIQSLWGNTWM